MQFKFLLLISLEEPRSPVIISSATDIQATSLSVKWTTPADDGGSPITAYRVVILKGSMEIKNENITDPSTTSWTAGGLTRTINYTVKVFARNAVFEGPAAEKKARTKYEGKYEMCVMSGFAKSRPAAHPAARFTVQIPRSSLEF